MIRIRFAPLPNTEELQSDSESDTVPDHVAAGFPLVRSMSTGAIGFRTAMERARLGIDDLPETSRRRKLLELFVPQEVECQHELSPEERQRRRELIRQIRPGGTGMVTLLDGGRIKARQVGNPQHEREVEEEIQSHLWGFAALAQRECGAKTPDGQEKEDDTPTTPPLSTVRRSSMPSPRRPLVNLGEEIYRRHEDEVRALGVEALEKHRKAKNAQKSTILWHNPYSQVSMPNPSPLYPRRPDARGHVVVPLGQLGIRPKRPQEGRFWTWDDSDDDDDNDSDGDGDDTGNQHMSQEDIDEDKRQCSMLWKHATSRAAAQEVVHPRRNGEKRGNDSIAKTSTTTSRDDLPATLLSDGDEFWPRRSRTSLMLDKYAKSLHV
ncbi:hypothetical protein MCUN1_002807 [Malassezia cuniculi]|uniref:Uncharacterized protein n=1 Tax=Malassezia cuniculi TaxID=948313 RepID=A0AAF0EX58_9BASI|nr:hypothetical protein MCUN1_002807 [Malassezia cuniculi]